ncbi:hypothetical protein N1851_028989 [Merluccius polli]|uniref:Uncharacterized protein n=1 Tax=Merluccius polli TaxID=89951 RepID=A0AA47M7S3_MERPO|nr:hypothetical protein N1851_028989 [Merluccius polli]
MDEHYKKNESMSGKHQHHQRRHGKNVCQPKTGLSSPTVEEIVAEYPRFVDMPYLRVNLQACHQFLRMTRLAIKHFKSSSSCCLQLDQGEGKATIGTSISSLLNPPERLVGYHQPHLVCIGQPNATAQYVIVAEKDKVAIPLEDYGLSFAIDKLFKMIWVCNARENEVRGFPEPGIEEGINNRVQGGVEVTQPNKHLKDSRGRAETRVGIGDGVQEERHPTEDERSDYNTQSLRRFVLRALDLPACTFTVQRPAVTPHVVDLPRVPFGNEKDLGVQAHHDSAGEEEGDDCVQCPPQLVEQQVTAAQAVYGRQTSDVCLGVHQAVGVEGGQRPAGGHHEPGHGHGDVAGVAQGVAHGLMAVHCDADEVEDRDGGEEHVEGGVEQAEGVAIEPAALDGAHGAEGHHGDSQQQVGQSQREDEHVGGAVQLLEVRYGQDDHGIADHRNQHAQHKESVQSHLGPQVELGPGARCVGAQIAELLFLVNYLSHC